MIFAKREWERTRHERKNDGLKAIEGVRKGENAGERAHVLTRKRPRKYENNNANKRIGYHERKVREGVSTRAGVGARQKDELTR